MSVNIRKIWKPLMSLALGITIFMLCLFPLRALMSYHEQSHLFRWNGYYLHEQMGSWHGCAEYIISFITQFFYVGWLGALVVALLAMLIQGLVWQLMRLCRIGKSWLFPLSQIPSILLFYYCFIPGDYRKDAEFREAVTYDYLVRSQKWDAILGKAYHHPPLTLNGIWCTNYALARKGMLLDRMFLFRQDSPDGLLMDANRMQPLALYSLSDIAFEIGLINSAERFAFDAKQQLPDSHKSGRIYQRLAEANLVNGHEAVTRKYMYVLQSTLFYRSWANKYLTYLGDEEQINSDERYGRLRIFRQQSDDQLMHAMDQALAVMVEAHPENKLAADYLLAYDLLRLDLEHVTAYTLMLRKAGYQTIPKAVQESIAGYWALSHPDDSLPVPINKDIFQTTMSFLGTVNQTGSMTHPSLDVPPYNQSYWHYHASATTKLRQQRP